MKSLTSFFWTWWVVQQVHHGVQALLQVTEGSGEAHLEGVTGVEAFLFQSEIGRCKAEANREINQGSHEINHLKWQNLGENPKLQDMISARLRWCPTSIGPHLVGNQLKARILLPSGNLCAIAMGKLQSLKPVNPFTLSLNFIVYSLHQRVYITMLYPMKFSFIQMAYYFLHEHPNYPIFLNFISPFCLALPSSHLPYPPGRRCYRVSPQLRRPTGRFRCPARPHTRSWHLPGWRSPPTRSRLQRRPPMSKGFKREQVGHQKVKEIHGKCPIVRVSWRLISA